MKKRKMETNKCPDKPTPCVFVSGKLVPLDECKFLNVEENIYGEDLCTFRHEDQVHSSLVVLNYF